jgi:hypothetical protein
MDRTRARNGARPYPQHRGPFLLALLWSLLCSGFPDAFDSAVSTNSGFLSTFLAPRPEPSQGPFEFGKTRRSAF